VPTPTPINTSPVTSKTTTTATPKKPLRSARRLLLIFSATFLLTSGYLYLTDTRASAHHYLAPPLLRHLFPDAEDAHAAGTSILRTLHRYGLSPRDRTSTDASGLLSVSVFGHSIANPIGISAGLDKHGDIPDALLMLGPGIVEIGGITPLPQEGNPKPRVWRVPSQKALINRYGLNSEGAEAVARKLQRRVREFARRRYGRGDWEGEEAVLDGAAGVPPGSLTEGRLLAVQIAKNKATPESDLAAVRRDYVACVQHLGRYADIIVVNVSSPNTPGLRELQGAAPLREILAGVVGACRAVKRTAPPRVMVKVSPDEAGDAQVRDICAAVWATGADGVIVANTTNARPAPVPAGLALSDPERAAVARPGGYSGPQLFANTLRLVRRYREALDQRGGGASALPAAGERKVIFASGGIADGRQAAQVLQAGASVAMVYTALAYSGVGLVTQMKREMVEALQQS